MQAVSVEPWLSHCQSIEFCLCVRGSAFFTLPAHFTDWPLKASCTSIPANPGFPLQCRSQLSMNKRRGLSASWLPCMQIHSNITVHWYEKCWLISVYELSFQAVRCNPISAERRNLHRHSRGSNIIKKLRTGTGQALAVLSAPWKDTVWIKQSQG